MYVENPPNGSVVMRSTVQPTVPKHLHFKCRFSDQHCMVILAMQRERKLEQRDSDEEESSTGLEDKEKRGNGTELTCDQALHVVPCDSK